MGDDRFYDAINLFKFSPTGVGARSPGGDPGYQATMSALIRSAIDKLWSYWAKDQIRFSSALAWDAHVVELGMSDSGALLLNPKLEVTKDPVKFNTPGEQALLASVSLTMAHEAVHAASGFARNLTEEVVCRVIEMLYYQDLVQGRVYTSKVAGVQCFAQLQAMGPKTQHIVNEHNSQLTWFQAGQLVDFVLLNSPAYVKMLTPDWILKSKTWWGGLKNRKPETKGFYLNALAPKAHRLLSYSNAILEILESIATNQEWLATGVKEKDVEKGLDSARYSFQSSRRIRGIQQKLGISLGVR